MKKLFLYPQWNYAKAEKFLENMEAQGYRLESAKCAFLFKFKKSTPKKARYLFLYNFMKDADIRHFEARDYLLGACKGNEICGRKALEPNIFRITDEEADISEVVKFRNAYLKRAFLLKIFLVAIISLPALLIALIGGLSLGRFEDAFLLSALTISAVAVAYYSVGIILLKIKEK